MSQEVLSCLSCQRRGRKGEQWAPGCSIIGRRQQLASRNSHMPAVPCNSIALLAVLTGTLSLSAIDFLGKGDQKQVLSLLSCAFWGK